MNIPFAVTVWDLQHRNNPWFPEVSELYEWDNRERRGKILRRASLIYTGTQQGREEIVSYYQVPPERIKVLPFATPVFALEAAKRPCKGRIFQKIGSIVRIYSVSCPVLAPQEPCTGSRGLQDSPRQWRMEPRSGLRRIR